MMSERVVCIFVTLDYVIEKCKKNFQVDVCNAIRNVRRNDLPFVQNPVLTQKTLQTLNIITQKYIKVQSVILQWATTTACDEKQNSECILNFFLNGSSSLLSVEFFLLIS